mgnify:CR=1 FL=1
MGKNLADPNYVAPVTAEDNSISHIGSAKTRPRSSSKKKPKSAKKAPKKKEEDVEQVLTFAFLDVAVGHIDECCYPDRFRIPESDTHIR